MTDQKVALTTAVLSKAKEFNYKAEYYLYPVDWTDNRKKEYEGYNVIHKNRNMRDWPQTIEQDYFDGIFSRVIPLPTQSLLQRWLREVHNINVFVEYTTGINGERPLTYSYRTVIISDSRRFTPSSNSYEQSLEEGLLEALKLIP